MWLLAASVLIAAKPLLAADVYGYTAPDGSVSLTDSPRTADFDLWWDDPEAGATLPNGVPMPRLDRIANLDAYDTQFLSAAAENGVPAELLKAVCVAESRMNPGAVSPAGARGLMQIVPSTARHLGVTDPFDPDQSIAGGAAYLAKQVGRFGTYSLAVATYNAGPEAVVRYGGIPPYKETRTYVSRVIGLYEHFRDNRPVTR